MAQRKIKIWEREYPNCAPAILDVITTFKDSTKRNTSRYAKEYCEKLKDVPQRALTQALSIYHTKTEKDKLAPHPNYFIATCLSLSKEVQSQSEMFEDEYEPPIILGRML